MTGRIQLLRHAGHDPYNSIYRYWERLAEKYALNIAYGSYVTTGGVDLRPMRSYEETMRRLYPRTFGKVGRLYKFRGRSCTQATGACRKCKGTGDMGGNHEREWIKCNECGGSGDAP